MSISSSTVSSHLLQTEVEAVILLFLRSTDTTEDSSAPCTPYRLSHLLSIAQAFFVLSVIEGDRSVNAASCGSGVCTERDLYYRNPLLFGSQRAAHASIERLCKWLDVSQLCSTLQQGCPHWTRNRARQVFCKPECVYSQVLLATRGGSGTDAAVTAPPRHTRESLGITAVGKSVLAGAIVLELIHPAEVVDVVSCGDAGVSLTYALVTRMVRCYSSSLTARTRSPALVVIEKESIFHAVLQAVADCRCEAAASLAFLCTKGYPCVAAQHWLRRVHDVWPTLSLHVLVDGDPHGLCIALTVMGLLGEHRRSGDDRLRPQPLPFHFIGVDLPRLFDGTGSARLSASEGTPLTRDDQQVLRRVTATVSSALTQVTSAASAADENTSSATRRTLETLMAQARWMERANVKCELQLACKTAETPLHFILRHLT